MADPLVVQVMRSFKLALLAREQVQQANMARAWLSVEANLQAEIEALARELAAEKEAGRSISQAKLYRMKSYQRLMAQLQVEMRKYSNYAESSITGEQRALAQLGIEHAVTATNAAAGGGIGVFFDVLPVEAVLNMVGMTGAGTPLRKLLEETWGDAAQGLTDILIRGTALGWNPRETARMMRQGMTRGLDRMLNIARTEQLRVYRETSRRQYETSGVVSGFRRLATHDGRVCAACLMAEGETYRLDETLRDHPSGRCTMVPIVMGMPPVKWQLGKDWFKEQPEDVQRRIMGPGRLDAWKRGEFHLEDLVAVRKDPVWGDRVEPAPLKELVPSK